MHPLSTLPVSTIFSVFSVVQGSFFLRLKCDWKLPDFSGAFKQFTNPSSSRRNTTLRPFSASARIRKRNVFPADPADPLTEIHGSVHGSVRFHRLSQTVPAFHHTATRIPASTQTSFSRLPPGGFLYFLLRTAPAFGFLPAFCNRSYRKIPRKKHLYIGTLHNKPLL